MSLQPLRDFKKLYLFGQRKCIFLHRLHAKLTTTFEKHNPLEKKRMELHFFFLWNILYANQYHFILLNIQKMICFHIEAFGMAKVCLMIIKHSKILFPCASISQERRVMVCSSYRKFMLRALQQCLGSYINLNVRLGFNLIPQFTQFE